VADGGQAGLLARSPGEVGHAQSLLTHPRAAPTPSSPAARVKAAMWSAGVVKPLPIVFRQRWVAPRSRQPATKLRHSSGVPRPTLSFGSRPIVFGSQRALPGY